MVGLEEYDFVKGPVEIRALEKFWSIEYSNEFEENITKHSALTPLYLAKSVSDESLEQYTEDELVNRMSTYYDRSIFHMLLFQDWMRKLDDGGPGYVTNRTAVYLLSNLLTQEFEGPHRYALATLISLCESVTGKSDTWSDRLYKNNGKSKKYFPSLQTEAMQSVKNIQNIGDNELENDGYDYLINSLVLLSQNSTKGEDVNLKGSNSSITETLGLSEEYHSGDIRNAIAHADFYIDFSEPDDQTPVVYLVGDNEYPLNMESLLVYFNHQIILQSALATGCFLAVNYSNARLEVDENIEKLAGAVLNSPL